MQRLIKMIGIFWWNSAILRSPFQTFIRLTGFVNYYSELPEGQTEFLTPQLTAPSQKNCSRMQWPAFPHFLYPMSLPLQLMRKGVTVKETVLMRVEEGEIFSFSQTSISWSVDSEYVLLAMGVVLGSSLAVVLLRVGKFPWRWRC